MPKDITIRKILIPGSGPIVIGQACEFDYSGIQACKALRSEGYKCILINSNPATIMTDPNIAEKTYIEPLTLPYIIKIIQIEKPDAILSTVGGQTALNLCLQLEETGILKKYDVRLLGANAKIIRCTESRKEFKNIISEIGLHTPDSEYCYSSQQAMRFLQIHGLPLVIRPSYTLGGSGGGIVTTEAEFIEQVANGLNASIKKEIIVEKSIMGWYEFELELMRDRKDNCIVVCSIENIDSMGIHTGDSITVCPQQTLSDRQYQEMRDCALKIIRAVGVETGGANIQFAVNPETEELIVVEMNPRVSRSSALASKATGFPIARIAALLAVGYSLDEITNTITQTTPCSFEPAIDYVVTKLPYFTFAKFPGSLPKLGTAMRSIGEIMSIGRTFKESLQKGIRSLEIKRYGLGADGDYWELLLEKSLHQYKKHPQIELLYSLFLQQLSCGFPERIFDLKTLLYFGITGNISHFSLQKISSYAQIHPWFIQQIQELIELEIEWEKHKFDCSKQWLILLKKNGYSDRQIGFLKNKQKVLQILKPIPLHDFTTWQEMFTKARYRDLTYIMTNKDLIASCKIESLLEEEEKRIFLLRKKLNVFNVYKTVDTCAGEFSSYTPYHYSTYENKNENNPIRTADKKILILGAGPNRIGQAIEFDYCCCHCVMALKDLDMQSIMCNSNPETISTDFDCPDKLFFTPIQSEEILEICYQEKPDGIIASFGGQSSLKLVKPLEQAGFHLLGFNSHIIEICEDREKCSELLNTLNIQKPKGALVHNIDEAMQILETLNFPLLLRPSFVLGGQNMSIVYEKKQYLQKIKQLFYFQSTDDPILIDQFLENALEVDVDLISDSKDVMIAGIMQHVEQAGIHSGDSSLFLPPFSLDNEILQKITDISTKIALSLQLRGAFNIQFAYSNKELYVLEMNPRASRTLPFISKAIGISLPKLATKVICGMSLEDLHLVNKKFTLDYYTVKASIFPFDKFPGSLIKFGPEMKSTGETMGIARGRGLAYLKALLGVGERIPLSRAGILITINDASKPDILDVAVRLVKLKYNLYATKNTAKFLRKNGLTCKHLYKKHEKLKPSTIDNIGYEKKIQLVINIFESELEYQDSFHIRNECLKKNVLCVTTVAAAQVLVMGLEEIATNADTSVISLQELHHRAINPKLRSQ